MLKKLAVAGAALMLAAGTAWATTLVRMDFSDLARDANYIVVGTVTDVEGVWDDSFTFIDSNVTISVERSYRGNAPDTLVLRTPGGEAGGQAQRADGAARFQVGERVFVFLASWEDGTPMVLGYVQGKSRLIRDAEGRERLKGGSADGRLLASVEAELRDGPTWTVPLRPKNAGGGR